MNCGDLSLCQSGDINLRPKILLALCQTSEIQIKMNDYLARATFTASQQARETRKEGIDFEWQLLSDHKLIDVLLNFSERKMG